MNQTGPLHQAFIEELRDTYDAEKQLTKAWPKLAKAAKNPTLRQAFETHLRNTQSQISRLEQVFQSLDETARGKHCAGIAGIIEEGKHVTDEHMDQEALDARLIAASQRAEHYEMAAYGTLAAWARAMGHTEAVRLLEQSLEEVKAADRKLSELAEGSINRSAAGTEVGDSGRRSRDGAAQARPGGVREEEITEDVLEGTFGLEGTRDGDVRRGGPLQQARESEFDERDDLQRTVAPDYDEDTGVPTDREPRARTGPNGNRRQSRR